MAAKLLPISWALICPSNLPSMEKATCAQCPA